MSKHARLSPSNLRWPHCPGSIREEANYPDIPNEAAIDGTGSHLLLEKCLNTETNAIEWLDQIIGVNHEDKSTGWKVSRDRATRVQICLDYVKQRFEELKEEYNITEYDSKYQLIYFTESKSNPGEQFNRNDWQGTTDIVIFIVNNHPVDKHIIFIEVIDYKDGRQWVNVNNNTQLISYLYGESLTTLYTSLRPDSKLRITIVQPKTNTPIRYQNLTYEELRQQAEQLAIAARKTDDPDAPLIPDDKNGKGYCRWCKHKPNCTALNKKALETMSKDIDFIKSMSSIIKDIQSAPVEKLTELTDARASIESIFDKVEKELVRRLENGDTVPGYEMRPGRASKVWNQNEETIIKMLRNKKFKNPDIYPPKLVSPAQVLKSDLLTKEQKEKIQKKYISEKIGTSKLTKVSYKTPESLFGDVVENNVGQSQTTELSLKTTAKKKTVSFF